MPSNEELARKLADSLAAGRAATRISGNKNSYKRDNPGEHDRVMAWLDQTGPRPTGTLTKMGQHLVLEEDVRIALSQQQVITDQNYPVSYYTGPLGANNILPSSATGLLTMIWCADSVSPANARTQTLERITNCGTFDGVGNQIDGLTVGAVKTENWVRDNTGASFVIINWNPPDTCANIAAGSLDATFTSMGTRFAAIAPFKIMLRMFIEFDQPGVIYGMGTTSTDAANFRAAWQRAVNVIHPIASNVGFWWCPVEHGAGATRDQQDLCYPGDTYVDWIGVDKYNHVSGFSEPYASGWAEFDHLVNYNYYHPGGVAGESMCDEWGSTKPFMIGETGTKYDAGDADRKADWYRNIDSVCVPHMPNLRGIQFFDCYVSGEGNDWRVDRDQPSGTSTPGSVDATTYEGFQDLCAVARWNVGVD